MGGCSINGILYHSSYIARGEGRGAALGLYGGGVVENINQVIFWYL